MDEKERKTLSARESIFNRFIFKKSMNNLNKNYNCSIIILIIFADKKRSQEKQCNVTTSILVIYANWSWKDAD